MFKLLLREDDFIVKSRQEAVLAFALFEKAPPQKVLCYYRLLSEEWTFYWFLQIHYANIQRNYSGTQPTGSR